MRIKLRRFRKYLAQIEALKEQISRLESQMEETSYYHEESISRANARARAAEYERVERERQAESDRWNKESELRYATKALKRAQANEDEYGIHQALRKLEHIY